MHSLLIFAPKFGYRARIHLLLEALMKKQVRLHTAIDRGVLLRKKKYIANINKVHMHRRLTATSSIPLHKQTKLGGGERGEGRGEFDTGSQLSFTNTQKSFYSVVQITKEKLQNE